MSAPNHLYKRVTIDYALGSLSNRDSHVQKIVKTPIRRHGRFAIRQNLLPTVTLPRLDRGFRTIWSIKALTAPREHVAGRRDVPPSVR